MTGEGTLQPPWWSVVGGFVGVGTLLGGAIDLAIGPTCQKRLKDWMETWWLRLSYVRWSNLGREEALFALRVMDRLFGRWFFSARRLLVVVGSTILVAGYMIAAMVVTHIGLPSWDAFFQRSTLTWLVLILLALSASFSVTKILSIIVARLLGAARYISLIGLVLLLLLQYAMVMYWSPIMTIVRNYIVNLLLTPADRMFIQMPFWFRAEMFYYMVIYPQFFFWYNLTFVHHVYFYQPNRIAAILPMTHSDLNPNDFMIHLSALLNLIPNLTRLSLAAVFVGSFLLRPLAAPISLFWRRVVEHEKPVFTLVFPLLFGGGAVLYEIVANLF